jgi:hypothetical protein
MDAEYLLSKYVVLYYFRVLIFQIMQLGMNTGSGERVPTLFAVLMHENYCHVTT